MIANAPLVPLCAESLTYRSQTQVEEFRLIAVICTRHQRKGIYDITGFEGLEFIPISWSFG